jgi:CBS domain-containing protein
MNQSLKSKPATRLLLHAETAAELMTPNPVSVRDTATVAEAIALLTSKGISAALVIDEAGRPVGVLSRSDILIHDRNEAEQRSAPITATKNARMQVRDLMTPVVFSVTPDTSVQRVVEDMVALNVHRLFVVDASRILVGVISAVDVLRLLRPE